MLQSADVAVCGLCLYKQPIKELGVGVAVDPKPKQLVQTKRGGKVMKMKSSFEVAQPLDRNS